MTKMDMGKSSEYEGFKYIVIEDDSEVEVKEMTHRDHKQWQTLGNGNYKKTKHTYWE